MEKDDLGYRLLSFKMEPSFRPFDNIDIQLYKSTNDTYIIVNGRQEKKILSPETALKMENVLNSFSISVFPKEPKIIFDGSIYELEINSGDSSIKLMWNEILPKEWKAVKPLVHLLLEIDGKSCF